MKMRVKIIAFFVFVILIATQASTFVTAVGDHRKSNTRFREINQQIGR